MNAVSAMSLLRTLKLAPVIIALAATPVAADSLAGKWAWNYRPLVIVAPNQNNEHLQKQRRFLKGFVSALTERDMLVIEIIASKAITVSGPDLGFDGSDLLTFLRSDGDTFEAMLLGKDTGIKLRSATPVSADEVFALIDKLPMRRQEMRQSGN